jgi:ribosome-binding protein aMBF1 (putative translation factor)
MTGPACINPGLAGHAEEKEAGPMTTDYEQLRAGRQAALNDDERANYSIIYAEAGLSGALAELVYRLRDEAGLTQTELARRMGSTQSSIARMEAGSQTPRIDLLDRLGRALGTPLTLSAAGHAVTFGVPIG